MEFEWDQAKSDTNLASRGLGFDFAALIFEGRTIEKVDDRRDYGEIRIEAIGEIDDEILVVIYTDRETARRIVSARLANKKERALWVSFANH
jgi:hypothetical protein